MSIRQALFAAAAAAGAISATLPAHAQTLTTSRIVSGLTQPLCVTHAPGDTTRLFVLERTGRVKIVNLTTNTANATPFLDVSTLVATAWLEYGLLGIAFHPSFQSNGFFYVNYTPLPTSGNVADTIVVRYKVSAANPDIADAASATPILRFGFGARLQHRAGWMDFGPDGYLYISTGDGAESDPDNAAQNTTLLRGKILRLDVNGPDGLPGTADDDGFPGDTTRNFCIPPTNPFAGSATNAQEIWAYGLRNPWRCSFDRLTGDMWIGDVGQNTREEVDFIPAGAPGGKNFGWRCTEGTFCPGLTGCTCNGPALTAPVYEYPHTTGLSVTGGYVYRGCAMPNLRGTYIFADYQNSKMFSFVYNGSVTSFVDRTAQMGAVGLPSAFGEDAAGELYFTDYSGGRLMKIIPATTPPPPLTITQHPAPASECSTGLATFAVTAASIGSPAQYVWQIEEPAGTWLELGADPRPLPGGGTAFATPINAPSVSLGVRNRGGHFNIRALVSNACASLPSNPAVLTVCAADYNCDAAVDLFDYLDFVMAFSDGQLAADFNHDAVVDIFDYLDFVQAFSAGC